jgi:RNA polymerase sigma-70 factor (ECF subfamily)
MDASDEQLVRQCKQQLPYDTRAFEVLLRRYEPLVFRTAARYLRNEQDAEEACQDVFLRVFHGLPRFEERSAFRTWLFRIVANVCAARFARLKKQAAKQAEFLTAASRQMMRMPEPVAGELEPIRGTVGEGLEMLPPDDRQILILRHISELSLEELAETLGISVSAAKMRLYRAERRLALAYDQAQSRGKK